MEAPTAVEEEDGGSELLPFLIEFNLNNDTYLLCVAEWFHGGGFGEFSKHHENSCLQ